MSHNPVSPMSRRERVLAAIDLKPLDRFPTDIWCVVEVAERLKEYAGTNEWRRVLDALDIDGIMGVSPPYIGPEPPDLGEGRRQNEWGMVYETQAYATGIYEEQVGYPLADAETIDDLKRYPWPEPDWYDYSALPDLLAAQGDRATMVGYTAVFYWHNQLRGLEASLIDTALRPEYTAYLMQRVGEFFLEYHQRCFEAAAEMIDTTQVTDDFGSQTGLLISKRSFERYYRPWMQRAMDLAKSYDIRVFHHDDGAIMELIPDLLEMGIDVLNPIQWRCKGMDRAEMGRLYAGKLCFHGGVDNQETLPFATADDVREEVAYNLRTLGRAGTGYIIAPCHNIQANTSMENILALYQAPRDIPETA